MLSWFFLDLGIFICPTLLSGFPGGWDGEEYLPMQETQVRSLGWGDILEKGMATHSSILAWRIPWTEEPGELQSRGLQRVRNNWETNTFSFQMYPGLMSSFTEIESESSSGVTGQSVPWITWVLLGSYPDVLGSVCALNSDCGSVLPRDTDCKCAGTHTKLR